MANEDAAQLDAAPDFAPMLSDVGNEATREAGRPAHRHLRLGARREQSRDRVTEALQTEVHFAQAVEEEQAGANGIILELLRDEFEWGQRGVFEQAPAERGTFQQSAAQPRLQRR